MRLSQVRLLTGLCLGWLAGCAANPSRPTSGEYQVSGQLKGTEGGALSGAQVLLSKLGESTAQPLARATAAADGRFSLVAPGPGDYSLGFATPGHPTSQVYLQVLPDERALSLDATLAPFHYLETLQAPAVVGSWNDRDFSRAEPLQAQPDGTWVLEQAVPGDRATYVFLNLASDASPVCVQAAGFELDAEGQVWCQGEVKDGKIRIVLDPRKLPRVPAGTPLRATFAPPYAFLEPLNALHARAAAQSVLASQRNVQKFDHGTLPGELLGFVRDSKQSRLSRQLVALDLLSLPNYDLAAAHPGDEGTALARELAELLPGDSSLWGLSFSTAAGMESLGYLMKPEDRLRFLEDLAGRNPQVVVQVYALYVLLEDAVAARDVLRATATVERLKPYEARHPFASIALSRYVMQAEQKKGQPAPAFSAPLLDGQGSVSRESLLGRFYVIDFWATWCKGCVAQLPFLEAAVEKFKGRGGFTVLSVSLDDTPEKVRSFRESTFKMPWLHVLNGGDMDAPLPKSFDVYALPTAWLVDAQGRIVATGDALTGKRLEETLDKLLPPAAP